MSETATEEQVLKFVPSKSVSKTERVLAKLERLTRKDDKVLNYKMGEYLASWTDFEQFVQQVEKWYVKNSKRYMRYMSQYARDVISEVEFKMAMRDLQVPFSDVQTHILYTWLDPQRTGKVEFARFYEALYRALYRQFAIEDEQRSMNLEYQNKWIRMVFKSPTCDPVEMPTTFEALINLGYTGCMLAELIKTRLPALVARNIVVFTDPARYAETLVHTNQKLYEFDYTGGPKCAPKEGTIFYEFSMGHIDCPLLSNLRSKESERHKEADLLGKHDAISPAVKEQTSSN